MRRPADLIVSDHSREETERWRSALRRHVEESGLSREDLASRLGLSPETVAQRLEENGAALHHTEVFAMLEAVGVSCDQFYSDLYSFPTLESMQRQISGLADALVEKGVVTRDQLKAVRRSPPRPATEARPPIGDPSQEP